MTNVTSLRQPFRKRLRSLFKLTPSERMGWLSLAMVVAAFIEDARGDTGRATFVLCLAILLYLMAKDREPRL